MLTRLIGKSIETFWLSWQEFLEDLFESYDSVLFVKGLVRWQSYRSWPFLKEGLNFSRVPNHIAILEIRENVLISYT